MPDNHSNQFPVTPEQETFQPSLLKFEEKLDVLAGPIPEISRDRELLASAGSEIIEQFGLKSELFEDDGRALVFTALASRWASNKESSGEEAEAEQGFLSNTVALLAHKYSDGLIEAHNQIESEGSLIDDETRAHVYDKYTNKELSAGVREKIDKGFLDDVKKQLGITPENEDGYEVRVLDIGDSHQTYGIDAPQPDYSLPYDHPDVQDAIEQQDQVKAWKNGLEESTIKFAEELGVDAIFAPAWVTDDLDGKRTLCISSGLAKKVIDPDIIKNTGWYTADDLAGDYALLAHEYTHTQGGIMLDRGITFGINIEELRAEHFSGNKQGYQDIKGFFRDYLTLTGHNVADKFDRRTKGGTSTEAFGSIANQVGLQKMLEVVMASPNNYIAAQSNSFIRETHAHIGGFDGVLMRILEQEMAAGRGDAVEERVQKSLQTIADIVRQPDSAWDVEGFLEYRRHFGLNVVTDLILEKAQTMQAKNTAQETKK